MPQAGDVRRVWPSEPAHFTPWLANHLGVLSEALEIGTLELVDTEVAIPGTTRALDILARLPTGELVAVENQFGTADHDHLTRGLAYAVGLEARALVLIAEGHLDEFRAVASYLNSVAERSHSDRRVAVYLAGLSVETVEEYVVPRLTVIESPNAWVQATSAVARPRVGSVEEFLTKVPSPAREAMKTIVEWWEDQPGGSIRYGAQTAISLDRPHPARPARPLSHVVFNDNGSYTINRGYLLEAGVVPTDSIQQFDDLLRQEFPDLGWTPKRYFLTGHSIPPITAMTALLTWLDAASTASVPVVPN